jgi:predicted ester cyclase
VAKSPEKTAPAQRTPEAVVREYFDALTRQDLDAAVAVWKPGAIDRLHGQAEMRAPDGIRDFFTALFEAFPDWRFEVLELAASGDLVAVRWRVAATFSGPGRFQGISPTGARAEVEGCDMLRVEDGLIVENNAYANGIGLAQQLGMLPPPDSRAERAMTAAFNARTAAVRRLRALRSRR